MTSTVSVPALLRFPGAMMSGDTEGGWSRLDVTIDEELSEPQAHTSVEGRLCESESLSGTSVYCYQCQVHIMFIMHTEGVDMLTSTHAHKSVPVNVCTSVLLLSCFLHILPFPKFLVGIFTRV